MKEKTFILNVADLTSTAQNIISFPLSNQAKPNRDYVSYRIIPINKSLLLSFLVVLPFHFTRIHHGEGNGHNLSFVRLGIGTQICLILSWEQSLLSWMYALLPSLLG